MSPTTLNTCDAATVSRLLRVGDSALILSQRLCERVAAAHSAEEDIAQANIALDLLGQARAWLTLAGETEGKGRDEDDLAYWRDADEFHNLLLTELPNGDFAQVVMRQFLFDNWHDLALRQLTKDDNEKAAAIAAKARKEVAYHLRHSGAWVERLGDGTEESRRRLLRSLDDLWGWCGQFFDGEVLSEDAQPEWLAAVESVFCRAGIKMPPAQFLQHRGHGEHLGILLAEMQSLHRKHPGVQW